MVVGDFIAGSLAASFAVTFTNPLDVLKTKLQLQSELAAAPPIFTSSFDAMRRIISTEQSIRSMQRGLSAAYAYQFLMNGVRFVTYNALKAHFETHAAALLPNMAAAAVAGATGAFVASPFALVKTRLQSFSSATALRTGNQHAYRGMCDALAQIYAKESWSGLYAGARSLALRTAVGSCAQLAFYDWSHNFFGTVRTKLFASATHRKNDAAKLPTNAADVVGGALIAGFMSALFICPFDVCTTRLYNQQPGSQRYAGIASCAVRSVRAEGLGALYKGFGPLYLRLAPHTLLTFFFYEAIRQRLKF